MDTDKLKERLLVTFMGELEEHVHTLETNALALEKAPADGRADLLDTLFRAAHSLKGAARSAGVPSIEGTCHRLEELLGRAREGRAPLGAEFFQTLLSSADTLAEMGRRLRAKESLTGIPPWMIPGNSKHIGTTNVAAAPPFPRDVLQEIPSGPGDAAKAAVRLPATKLDALVTRSGELLIARRRAANRRNEILELRETVGRCMAELRWAERAVRGGADSELAGSASGPANLIAGQRPISKRAIAAVVRTKDHLKKLERDLERIARGLSSDNHLLAQAAAPLEDEVRNLQMLPFGDVCEGLERVVRDVAKAGGKDIELKLEGTQVQLDRAILSGLRGPLQHLVRNAADHGIEPIEERIRNRKPPSGRIAVSAELRGSGSVEIVVADDGRGLDLGSIRDQVRKQGQAVPETEREQVRLIFQAGLSTARLVTEFSGRGVGLDAVKHGVESLHGSVDVSFETGRGTRFILELPITLTTLRALLVRAGGQTFALPSNHVRRLLRAGSGEIAAVEGREVLLGGDSPVPIASLAETLGLPANAAAAQGKVPLVVVAVGKREVAFAVDELMEEQDVVVKNLGRRLRWVRHFAGVTALPTGRLALILAPTELIQTAITRSPGSPVAPRMEEEVEALKRRLLVVDDSVTTRTLEKSILEAAGYEVFTASDGAEAWQLLKEMGADLVVADVEMPRMDGFGLTEAIRASKRFRDLPVILVTALETDRDKARGLEVGANAYLPKRTFDQKQLLETINRLL